MTVSCSQSDTIVSIQVVGSVVGVRRLRAMLDLAGQTRTLLIPDQPRSISLPTSFTVQIAGSVQGRLDVTVEALDTSEIVIARGSAPAFTLTTGQTNRIQVVLAANTGGPEVDGGIPDGGRDTGDAFPTDTGSSGGNGGGAGRTGSGGAAGMSGMAGMNGAGGAGAGGIGVGGHGGAAIAVGGAGGAGGRGAGGAGTGGAGTGGAGTGGAGTGGAGTGGVGTGTGGVGGTGSGGGGAPGAGGMGAGGAGLGGSRGGNGGGGGS